MTLRDYRPADFATLCEIDRTCFPPGVAYPPQDLAYWLRQPGAFAMVAEDEQQGRVAGFVLARALPSHSGHIVTIDLLPEYRRGGLGTELMERAHARLKEMGAQRVRLETSVENAAAIAFFNRLGYQATRLIPRYYLNRINAWEMTREL